MLTVAGTLPATGGRQTLDQRIDRGGSGKVHLSFAARPGVCGDGAHNISIQDNEDWEVDCEPVNRFVSHYDVRDHRVVTAFEPSSEAHGALRSAAKDLGTIRPQEAAAYFMHLAGSARV